MQPWLTIAAIPGALNLSIALKELDKQCRSLPFFEPYKSIGFWFWVFLQIGFPSVCFWLDSDLTSQPTTYQKLVMQSLLFGLSFITIFNAEAKIGDQTYNIKVHRKHLPEALYDFGCSDLCQKYFPNRSLKPLKQLHLGRDI